MYPDDMRLDAKDMIPLVYSRTREVEPVHVQLQKDHEKIKQKHEQNPGAHFGDLAQKFYEKREKKEEEEHRRMVMSQRQLGAEVKSNYLPSCHAVKRRMDSEHLNTWLLRSEIQYAAERYIEF